MVGSDICGFFGNTTEELCSRWIQIGAVLPFARSHNHESSLAQEFDQMGPTLLKTAKVSLKLRYSILKYYYSIFILSVKLFIIKIIFIHFLFFFFLFYFFFIFIINFYYP